MGKASVNNIFFEIGDLVSFTLRFIPSFFLPPYEWEEMIRQTFILGYRSLLLITISAFIIGFVMTIHLIPSMRVYGVEDMVPNMAAVSIIREIGPVITALVCAGKIGSSIGAELGSMKVTEQIDAMAITGVDTYAYLVTTRTFATSFSVPILTIYACAIALAGAFVAENLEDQMSLQLFVVTAFNFIYFHDFIPTLIKSLLFGFAIGIIGSYYGIKTEKGAAGVGKSTHKAVVISSLVIFFIDLLVVEIAHMFY